MKKKKKKKKKKKMEKIEVLPYLIEYFPTTFDKIQPPLYYISSGLSFYFIYDFCLYSNMSPLVSYFLRYLPLFTAIITATVVLGIRRNFKKKALSWHGLWWIILLMYSHILHTSMSILNCPILPARDGSLVPRWYVNGTVKCFTGGHAALGLLAILVLVVCVAIIPLSLTYITGKLQHPWMFRRSFEPLAIPFKEQYKWWSSVELGRRIILVLFVVAFPQNEYAAIFVLMITVAVYGYVQPFQCQAVNILETFLSINTIVLLLLRNTNIISDNLGSLRKQPSHNDTNFCRDEIEGVTDFSWLLLPVYYLPLVTCCTVGGVWIALKGWHYYVERHDKTEEAVPEEQPKPAQSHGVTEYYLNVEASAGGEVAMVYYRPTPTESTSNS